MKPLRPALVLPLVISVALAGCGGWKESRVNPRNWFGKSETVQTLEPKGGYIKAKDDHRQLVADVSTLEIKRTPTGAIVSVTGLPPTQGWWGAALLADDDARPVDGVITYRFVVAPPEPGSPAAQRVASPASRTVTAAAFINNTRLAATHKIVVIGAQNERSISR